MIVNERKRWVVITPPKTGSSTLLKLLCSPPFGGVKTPPWHHDTAVPSRAADFRAFLSVRDPFARASSLFRLQARGEFVQGMFLSFREYAEHGLLGRKASYFHWMTLCDWWPAAATPIRLEDLPGDLAKLEPEGDYEVPVENMGHELWTSAYDREPDAWPFVAEWAESDCIRFGYRMRG